MKKKLFIPALGCAVVACSTLASARQIVVLPGVVNPVGVLSGVDTQGPGALTVGNQDINTGNDSGGAITTDAANTANIVFNGTSNVTGFVGKTGATFLNIAAGANASTVTFGGPVFATTFSVSGKGTVNFNGGFTSNTGSTLDFAGDGFITVGAGQTATAAVTNSGGANTGTLTLFANSTLNGAVGAASALKQINVVGGNALITGQANASTYNLGANTLNVAGAFAIPVAGNINTTILSPSLFGRITPVGFATIGNALHVNVTVTGPIANGSSFNVVNATSGTTGSTVIATDTNSLRYAFTAAPTTNGLVRITTVQIPLLTIITSVVNGAVPGVAPVLNPTVAVAAAPAVDGLLVTPATNGLLTAITLLPTAQAVTTALAQLGESTTNLEAPHVSYRATQLFQNALASHLESIQEACNPDNQPDDRNRPLHQDASACQPGDMRSHVWMTAFGNFGKQGTVNGIEGYDAHTLGVMAAYEVPLSTETRAGIGLRYANSQLESHASDNRARVNSYQAMAYLGFAPGAWFANAAAVYGWDKYTGSRHVVFPGVDNTALSDYSGRQLTGYATTGYHFYLGDGRTVITPLATLQYTHLTTHAYTETNGGAIDLNVNAQKYNFLQSGLGAKIAHDFPLSGSQVARPELHANWLHSFGNETMRDTTTFTSGGPAFTTVGLKPSRETYNAGAGITFANSGAWSVEGVYDYQWRSDKYKAHQAMINFVARM